MTKFRKLAKISGKLVAMAQQFLITKICVMIFQFLSANPSTSSSETLQ